MQDIYTFLESHSIAYDRCDHVPVYTCEEAKEHLPDLDGEHTKNLFLRNKKGNKHYLVVVPYEKNVDLKALDKVLESKGLSFASPERLQKYLGVEPGSATILGLMHDADCTVTIVIDSKIWDADALLCHPLVNTATLTISHKGIASFLQATGHTATVIDVPRKS